MADLKQSAEQLVNLTVKEVNELATILKDEYGTSCCNCSSIRWW
jgi:large subunit ribosomal protein L7/L12